MADNRVKDKQNNTQFIQDLKKTIADNTSKFQESLTKTQISNDLSKIISDYQKNIADHNTDSLSPSAIQEWVQNLTQMMTLGQKLSLDIFLNSSKKH